MLKVLLKTVLVLTFNNFNVKKIISWFPEIMKTTKYYWKCLVIEEWKMRKRSFKIDRDLAISNRK